MWEKTWIWATITEQLLSPSKKMSMHYMVMSKCKSTRNKKCINSHSNKSWKGSFIQFMAWSYHFAVCDSRSFVYSSRLSCISFWRLIAFVFDSIYYLNVVLFLAERQTPSRARFFFSFCSFCGENCTHALLYTYTQVVIDRSIDS